MDDAQTPDARTPGAQSPSTLVESVRWVRSDRLLLVWLRGAIDPVHADLLNAVRSDAARGDRVVLDLSDVSFFGATGLNFLAGLVEKVCAPVIISDLPDFVRTILLRSGMHPLVCLPTR